MTEIKSSLEKLTFIKPDPVTHARITLGWFESDDGRETLLLMGNAESEIEEASIDTETQILGEFVLLEQKKRQITWMINYNYTIVGVAWIELIENHNVKAPSVHLMIGNKEYRGKGLGKASMTALIDYIRTNINTEFIYSRHLKSNFVVVKMNESLGFENDGEAYIDDNKLEWQNVKLVA